jgi:hypothetical protein
VRPAPFTDPASAGRLLDTLAGADLVEEHRARPVRLQADLA